MLAPAVLLSFAPLAYCYDDSKDEDNPPYCSAWPPAEIIPVKNQMPLYVFYLNMLPDSAQCLPEGKFRADLDYQVSNSVLDKVTTGTELYIVQIDTEIYRVSTHLRYGIADNLEASVEIPYIGLSEGYLDGFVENFEKTFNFTTLGARENSTHYSFKYEVRYEGKYLIQKNSPTSGLGDTTFYLKYKFLEEDEYEWYLPTLSTRCALKLPTGDKDELTGSGKTDFGVGLLLDKHVTEKLAFYANTNFVFIQKPDFFEPWSMKSNIFSWMAAIEYHFTDKFSAILQHMGNTTPYPKSGTHPLDNDAADLGLGLTYRFNENLTGTISCIENLLTDSSPDVSFHSGIKYNF